VYAVTNFLRKPSLPHCVGKLDRAPFTDYNKATRVRKFYTAYTGVVKTNCIRMQFSPGTSPHPISPSVYLYHRGRILT